MRRSAAWHSVCYSNPVGPIQHSDPHVCAKYQWEKPFGKSMTMSLFPPNNFLILVSKLSES